MSRNVHLVGSVGLADAATVFRTVSETLGECCPRIPDGETGERGYWVRWQMASFENSPAFVNKEITEAREGFKDNLKRVFYNLDPTVDPATFEMDPLGYAVAALESWAAFSRMQAAGEIGPDVRFQVALPTPMALLQSFVQMEDRLAAEPIVERAMLRDVQAIQDGIPHDKLCIQWDVCFEILGADGGPALPYADPVVGSIERVVRLCTAIAPDAECGIHLCYGDPGHKHIVEPPDLAVSVAFANGITQGAAAQGRTIAFVHMPVPRDRDDAGYVAPLQGLSMTADTRLALGLVHFTDGEDGICRRMAAADAVVPDYDVATECGFGRRDPATVPDLLRLHRTVCDT